MEKLIDIIKIIEDFAPLDLQGDFDNCGLKLGNINTHITGIMVTLDTNCDVVAEAIDKNCNLIIEHHPSIFNAIKSLDWNLPLTKAIHLAIKNDIAVYSAHTNIDFCKNGLNDYVAGQAGLCEVTCFDNAGNPRIGKLKEKTTLKDYAEKLKSVFNDKNITTIGNIDKTIEKVAIVNGGGGSSTSDLLFAIEHGADVFVTGDVKYNVARLAKDANYAIIQVGHYNSEQGFGELIENILKEADISVPVYKATRLLNPYN